MLKRYPGPFKRVIRNEIVTDPVEVIAQMTYNRPPLAPTYNYWSGEIPAAVQYYDSYLTPHFNKLVDDGWIIQCPFVRTRVSSSICPGNIRVDYRTGTSPASDVLTNFCTFIHSDLAYGWKPLYSVHVAPGRDAAHSEALTRAFAKANSGNADLLIELSQLKKTVAMFVKACKTFVALLRSPGAFLDLVREHLRGTERYVRIPPHGRKVPITSLEGLWCELRFGWRPLLASLQGVIDALNRDDLGRPKRSTYRATENVDTTEKSVTIYNTKHSTGCLVVDEPAFRHTETLRYNAEFRAGILLEDSATLLSALGLDARSIPIALWDCIPYSFIVDRFINVGNYIRSLRPVSPGNFGGAWVAERFTVEHGLYTEFLPVSKSCGSGTSYRSFIRSPGYCQGSTTIEGYTRVIHDSPPLTPTLRHDWSELVDIYNLVDAAMLAIQLARRRILHVRN